MYPGDAEFGFELLVCRWAEAAWPPGESSDAVARRSADSRTASEDDVEHGSTGNRVKASDAVLVARQLGTKRRRWDTIVIECDPAGLAARAQFGERELDSDLLHIVRNAPAEWAWYRDALPYPGYPWRYVRAAVHRAAGRGVVEKRRKGNRIEIRRIAPYPDWVRRIVAIENKPDLDASAARALSGQLTRDVETALADEVWVATHATGNRVEPALLEDVPVEVGILAFTFDASAPGDEWADATVEWHPSDVTPADAEADENRRTTRLELAERAYGSGWRSYHDTMRPDCRHFELRRVGRALVPHCAAKGRPQTAAECAGSCPDFEPEPPVWRTGEWPITGGPGKGIKRLLRDRREWVREREYANDGADRNSE
ncbi:hypothetical protein GL213_09175 [Halogeometricum borinquense]|uniref:Uncharacterized protein n=1 Tax=Halogeometricum borinquense TaxID=60847 RepID=A0A6C0UFG1_9EURY|nr:DUF5787 family protein [Halogeometricum borinquense]QIB74115.1 hypothetical protein G3I44_07300 [Halogeometricum borinquense]QIQ76679.1 hypothetical protein GL213_09175 [Halogeometricum borinquense]